MSARFEHLETRRMLANAPQPVDWVIQGTNANDIITITQSGNTVTVNNNGVVSTHAAVGYYIPGPSPYQQIAVAGLRKIIVHGRDGNDQILANDTVQVPMEVWGGFGRDTIKGGAKDDLLKGFAQTHDPMTVIDYLGDEIHGHSGNDAIYAFQYGPSTLHGGDGDDFIWGSDYNDVITGGRGNDDIFGHDGHDNIVAGPTLVLFGNSEDSDTVTGMGGNDTIDGGVGNDVLIGNAGNDSVIGGVGNDEIYLGEGDDRASGGSGNDLIQGDADNDSLYGEAGDDTVQGGSGADWMSGDDGYDEISYTDHTAGVKADLQGGWAGSKDENDYIVGNFELLKGGSGNDTLFGSNASEKMYGGAGHDQIDGRGGNDSLYGEAGNDSLFGGTGADKLYGNEGDDNLSGGRDPDSLFGGAGNDTLVSVGGTTSDKSWGEDGTDSFWMDNNSNEWIDATPFEHNDGRVHKISSFVNSTSIELDGQDLSDPVLNSDAPLYKKFPNRPLFSSLGPTIDDIDQGAAGDCYFLAGLAAVAQKGAGWIHERICDLGDGTYAVMFNGSYIRVDNELPTTSLTSNASPAYASFGLEGPMWVAIMEKAFAMIRTSAHSYASLDSGPLSAPFDLLGIPNEHFWDEDNDDLLLGMSNALNSGDAVTALTHEGTFEDGMMIVPEHAYTVVSVNLNNKTIRLRNPWKTDAGAGSESWSDGNNDGYFTVTIAQFRAKFCEAAIGNI